MEAVVVELGLPQVSQVLREVLEELLVVEEVVEEVVRVQQVQVELVVQVVEVK
jgi:hypothetical protein